MMRRCLIGGFALLASVSLLAARQGVVKTTDGRSIEGDISETREGATILAHGAQITIARENIASVDYPGDIREQYEQRLAKLGPKATAKDHLDLARWLFQSREYDLARAEAEKAKALDPQDTEIPLLIKTIYQTKLLETAKGRDPGGPAVPVTGPVTKPIGPAARKFLTPDQIQVIKQCELTDNDDNVRVQLTNNVVKRFIEYKNITPADFARNSPYGQARQILADGTAEMRQDVKILSDPAAIATFKQVQRTILSGCATAACHGGPNAGNFVLYTAGDNEPMTYTNFYILARYAQSMEDVATKTFVEQKMVNRLRPDDSLVLQMGLPRAQATLPHKDVAGMKPTFANGQQATYQALRDWISSLRTTPLPGRKTVEDYGIDLPLPTGVRPTTNRAP